MAKSFKTRIGYCRYCKRPDAEVYDQKKGVHNEECRECWALYSSIRDFPDRNGVARRALRLALKALRAPIESSHSPKDLEAILSDKQKEGVERIRRKLEKHPIAIDSKVNAALREILNEVAISPEKAKPHKATNTIPEEVSNADDYFEGACRRIWVNAYERDAAARLKCIEHYGASCCVCNCNFGSEYGPLAQGFIHVHHLRPLATIGVKYVVDPIEDLRPVCPNCHAVIHLAEPCLSIEEVRDHRAQALQAAHKR